MQHWNRSRPSNSDTFSAVCDRLWHAPTEGWIPRCVSPVALKGHSSPSGYRCVHVRKVSKRSNGMPRVMGQRMPLAVWISYPRDMGTSLCLWPLATRCSTRYQVRGNSCEIFSGWHYTREENNPSWRRVPEGGPHWRTGWYSESGFCWRQEFE